MDFLPAFTSTVQVLKESSAIQNIKRRLHRSSMTSPEMCWPVPMRAIGAQNLLTMPGGVSTAGYLHKKGGSQFSLMKWPLRYIIIHKGCVYYFKSSTSPAPQGAFSLNGYNRVMRAAEETTSSNVFPFKIVHFSKNHRTWFFSAASEDERRKWMRHLRKEIDHYNDRRESHIPSDSDSDADSFYGTIERLMDIKHTVGNPEDDYMEEDDDEEEEDYIRPDTDCSPTTPGRPAGPPPSYPPPPVPAALHHWLDSSPGFHKGPPPPIPLPSKMPPSSLAKKPPPPFPPPTIQKELCNKGPPPPLPFASHLQKSSCLTPPIPPPPNQKKQLQGRMSSMPEGGGDKGDRRPPPSVTIISSALCSQFESKMSLNGSAHHSSAVTSGSHSPIASRQGIQSNHVIKQGPPLPPPNTVGSIQKNTGRRYGAPEPHLPPPSLPPMSPHSPALPKPSVPSRPLGPKPPPPIIKPPLPTAKPRGPPIQRTSPEGQSFRSSLDEIPADRRKSRKDPSNHSGRQDDSDEEYENVQLPDSVFIDTTESSWVEKLFKESAISPQDGLYGIRNSSTKTSKVLVVWDVSLGKARNYRLFEEDQRVFLDNDVTFPSLSALVEHYHSHPLPHHGSLCLQKPYGYALPR